MTGPYIRYNVGKDSINNNDTLVFTSTISYIFISMPA